jgi:hypothetical protein
VAKLYEDAGLANWHKAQFEMLEYDRLSQQGTNDASSIKERLNIIRKYCKI